MKETSVPQISAFTRMLWEIEEEFPVQAGSTGNLRHIFPIDPPAPQPPKKDETKTPVAHKS